MESMFHVAAEHVALGAEVAATVLIALGCIDAIARMAALIFERRAGMRTIKDVWLRLAGWILLALEFALAADIVRTSISPTWEDLGKLAGIAAIRTVLSVFLERDLDAFEKERAEQKRIAEAT
jgi:uncharacterized membrane protein